MFCEKCGKQISQDAKFCAFCGVAVLSKKVCPTCGQGVEPNMLYCSSCGTKLNGMVSSQQNFAEREIPREPVTGRNSCGTLETNPLATAQLNWYEGDVSIGIVKAEGIFSVYRDRIEYKKTRGGAGTYAFGLVSMAISASRAKKEDAIVFWMDEIADVRESSYMMCTALVLELKNGQKYTFSQVMQTDNIRNCITFIKRYIH